MSDAKSEILARVRAALKDVPAGEQAGDVVVTRDYRRVSERPAAEVIDQFAAYVSDYRADVTRVPDAAALPAAIAAALRARGARRVAIPHDLPAAWRVDGIEWVEDRELPHDVLGGVDGVLTGCAVAIAINGTLVLDGGPGQGRRVLTLLPDYHLCVVYAEQVVELVPEGIARLHASARAGRAMTIVAGPSATSDIEFSRVEGVHGPRTLDVLVVG